MACQKSKLMLEQRHVHITGRGFIITCTQEFDCIILYPVAKIICGDGEVPSFTRCVLLAQ